MIEDIVSKLKKSLEKASEAAGISLPQINLSHPESISHGDYTTNTALVYSKELKIKPVDLAGKILDEFKKDLPDYVKEVLVAAPGFINIKIKDSYFADEILSIDENFGRGNDGQGKKVMVEYTDPNPFKIFHIGHLMANSIGESLSRIVEFTGSKVLRANYYGDVGLHVAKTMWAILKNKKNFPKESENLLEKLEFLGKMYVEGSNIYETNEEAKKEIQIINKKIFEKSDQEINAFYDAGKKWSLEYFETIYKRLGTKFDYYFPESEVAEDGAKIVKENLEKGIFRKSEGAIIFPGEDFGLHTRVFINSEGLPTYEAKELGLTKRKFEEVPDLKESIVVTANEQNDYFKVLLKSLSLISPEMALKTKHISHGLLRPSTGKMSSRKGNIVAAEDLISEFADLVEEKIKDRDFPKEEHDEVKEIVSIAALKYTILRQAIGGDIIYDPTKAVSFEGDSGPYLQYSCVRAKTVLTKAKEAGMKEEVKAKPDEVTLLEKLLVRFPEVIERARLEYAPHHIVTYLTELAGAFNSYYGNNKIIDLENPLAPYRVALTKSFVQVMENGLWILGIKVPGRM